jgi:hypothetical protein
MTRPGLVVLFFGLFGTLSGQDLTITQSPGYPYADGQAELVASLMKSFDYEEEEPIFTDTLEAWEQWHTVQNFEFGKNRGHLPMIADLNSLHPYFRDKVARLIEACREKGIELAVVEAYRTKAKQNEYRSMGKKYTRSVGGLSKHQYGLAVDVVPIVDSVAQWHNSTLWRKVGLAGEKLGMRWGGRWRYLYDPGHFEWTGGLTSYHLTQGAAPRIPQPDAYPCLEEELTVLRTFWEQWEADQAAAKDVTHSSKAMK